MCINLLHLIYKRMYFALSSIPSNPSPVYNYRGKSYQFVERVSIERGDPFTDPSDDNHEVDMMQGNIQRDQIYSVLSPKQKKVAELIEKGLDRRMIANELQVCLQAVHQIIGRMRERILSAKFNEQKYGTMRKRELIRGLIYFYFLTIRPERISYETLISRWNTHTCLRDYKLLDEQTMRRLYKDVCDELYD